jgi:hypothetical protein
MCFLCSSKLPQGRRVVKRALPTASAALLRSTKQPVRRLGSSQAPNRRTGFGLCRPWITLKLNRSPLGFTELGALRLLVK